MGILVEIEAMLGKLRLPSGFTVCEFGDQYLTYLDPPVLAVELYRQMGCGRYEAIDGNGRGTITADLNRPLSDKLRRQFDLVTDFGTGEHIFNQMQVWQSLHQLVRVGGFIAFDRPSKGYDGHCFYLVQENLFLALVHANYYGVIHFEKFETTRGELIRGVFQRRSKQEFRVPQQGRYFKSLVIDEEFTKKGPDYKSGLKQIMGMR